MKTAWHILVSELTLKSTRPGIGSDTLVKLLLMLAVCAGFYFWVHGFNYETPQPRKIAWHRAVATGMTFFGVTVSLGEYLVCLTRRIQQHIKASHE